MGDDVIKEAPPSGCVGGVCCLSGWGIPHGVTRLPIQTQRHVSLLLLSYFNQNRNVEEYFRKTSQHQLSRKSV
jgi:hypothetical protein